MAVPPAPPPDADPPPTEASAPSEQANPPETTGDDADADEAPLDPAEAPARAETRLRLEAAATEIKKRKIAEQLRTEDLDLAECVRALGFTEETARVFDLLPMIHVAWADGEVQAKERKAILDVLAIRDVAPGTPAHTLVTSLLETPPGKDYVEESLALLRSLVESDNRRAETLVDLCVLVARAHGTGWLGLRDPVDGQERAALDAVAQALGSRATLWLKAKFAG